jgi:hypothetical protein
MNIKDFIKSHADSGNTLIADGFEDAIIGMTHDKRVLYNAEKMIQILINDGLNYEDSYEYLAYNTFGAYMGEFTPIYGYFGDDMVEADTEEAIVAKPFEEAVVGCTYDAGNFIYDTKAMKRIIEEKNIEIDYDKYLKTSKLIDNGPVFVTLYDQRVPTITFSSTPDEVEA